MGMNMKHQGHYMQGVGAGAGENREWEACLSPEGLRIYGEVDLGITVLISLGKQKPEK